MIIWWAIGICLLAHSYCHTDSFLLLYSLLFSCIKHHKLVWYVYRKWNFIRVQHYCTLPFRWCLRLILRTWSCGIELSLSFYHPRWCYDKKDFIPLLDIPCKRGLRIKGLISWLEKFQSAFISRFDCILPFLRLAFVSLLCWIFSSKVERSASSVCCSIFAWAFL